MANLVPQVAGFQGFRHLAVDTADQRPVGIVFDRLQKRIGDAHGIVGILARDRQIRVRIPIGVIGRKFDRGIALPGILQHALDVTFRDHRLFRRADGCLQTCIHRRVQRIRFAPVPSPNCRKNIVQTRLMQFGTGNQRCNLLFFNHLPVDEFLNIGVIHIADHHFRSPPGCAARLDRPCRAVADFQE